MGVRRNDPKQISFMVHVELLLIYFLTQGRQVFSPKLLVLICTCVLLDFVSQNAKALQDSDEISLINVLVFL